MTKQEKTNNKVVKIYKDKTNSLSFFLNNESKYKKTEREIAFFHAQLPFKLLKLTIPPPPPS